MSLKFDEAIQIVANKLLETTNPKNQAYSEDAAEITAKIDQELININSIFKGTVSNWNETIDFIQSEVPKLSTPILRLNMPFAVEPQRVFVFNRDNVEPVNLKTSVNHPAVENGYLNGEKLTQLFIWDLNRVIDKIAKITCSSGKVYKLSIQFISNFQYGKIITIVAMENGSKDDPSILYNFLLSLKFSNKSDNYSYVSNFFHQFDESALNAASKIISKKYQNLLVLLQTLVNQFSKIALFDLIVLVNSDNVNLGIGIGSLLLEVIPRFIPSLQNPGPLIIAYGKLLQMKQLDSVQLSEIKEVFGLK